MLLDWLRKGSSHVLMLPRFCCRCPFAENRKDSAGATQVLVVNLVAQRRFDVRFEIEARRLRYARLSLITKPHLVKTMGRQEGVTVRSADVVDEP